jgi:hypothetical protein
MSINLIAEHSLPESYYLDVETTAVENYTNRKQMAAEIEETILLVTPITEESAQIPLLLAPAEFGV